ncbi:hypothetical protein [Candidatus Endoriftia persephone]|uniref:SPOR domain-containing protein n=1 Tax=Candidatus Endoriftia persephonae TaxID=393765 RepID=A0A9J6ZUU0_9GAMM|nr:hypothetical protein [Candidatus Endoriftia persephone]USF86566.1 hypothetical protein L0Y14_10490 [Candidatus Endoriftia persephone]
MEMNKPMQMGRFVLFFVLLAMGAGKTFAGSKIMDRIETKIGVEENRISIFFNVPMRIVSHLINAKQNEISIRIKPVVTPGTESEFLTGDETFSWRATAEVPLERVVFNGSLIGNSTLSLSFATPISKYEIEQGKGFFSLSLILKKQKKVQQIKLLEPAELIDVPQTKLPVPSKDKEQAVVETEGVVTGDYVLNLLSQRVPIDFSKVAPVPVPKGRKLYAVKAEVEGVAWYRLRMGFFSSKEAAKIANREVRHFYSDSWIDLASTEEKDRLQAETGVDATIETLQPPVLLPKRDKVRLDAPVRLTKMMEKAREIMTAQDYPKAIRMLTAILEEKTHAYSKEALELLGLARERNDQVAHAKAEYRRYLELYPEGEDAKRVNQRLVGLISAAQTPKEKLRESRITTQPGQEREAEWEVYGSLSQSYQRDASQSNFIDTDVNFEDEMESVNRSEIATSLDISARRRSQDYDLRFQFSGGYDVDLLTGGSGDQKSLTEAFIELDRQSQGLLGRVGRQRFRSSGILSRFDGGVFGYQFNEDTRFNIYTGFPVDSSKDVFIRQDKWFYGANMEMDALIDDVDVILFAIEQRTDHLVDRRAIGTEVRYFDENLSVFGQFDYDIFHNELAMFLFQSNWSLTDDTKAYINLDYRSSPIITTSNALQGQEGVSSIKELSLSFTDDEIYQLALDRTANSTVVSLGGTHFLARDFQLSGDLTVANTSGTSASGGVDATAATGNEFYYTFQVLKNNLLKNGDIGILNLRYIDANSANTYSLTANSRYPVTSLWRVNPRLSLAYRDSDDGTTRLSAGGRLQADYRVKRDLLLEMELGASWNRQESSTTIDTSIDYFLLAGYRWNF